jgi:hypothetical protein
MKPFVRKEAVSVVADSQYLDVENRIVKAGPSVKTLPGGSV